MMLRALLNLIGLSRAAAPAVEPTVEPVVERVKKNPNTARSDKRRAELKALGFSTKKPGRIEDLKVQHRCNVAPVAYNVAPVAPPPLSLKENKNPSRERARVSLPENFQPDDKTREVLAQELGEAAGAVLLVNFRDHYGSKPSDRRTLAEWQATLRKWARNERQARDGPRRLPLVRAVPGTGPQREQVSDVAPAPEAKPRPSENELDAQFDRLGLKHLRVGSKFDPSDSPDRKEASG